MHKMSYFSKKIISWQKINGRNNLPWQAKSPYHIWISEIMLQQTQVKTVIPYFHKFINSFPSIKSLAKSDLDKVLANWSGLGYYTRAKNIHQASKIIHQKYKTKYNNINKGTFHKSNQLKKIKWETPILYYLKKISV